jgi:hypothetical protein
VRQIGNENSLILQIDAMSEYEQRFTFVRGLKPNVKLEVEKEWVKMAGMSITQMKQLV